MFTTLTQVRDRVALALGSPTLRKRLVTALVVTGAFAVAIMDTTGHALASTVAGINTGTGSLQTVMQEFGINTNGFDFGQLVGVLLKPLAAYQILHSLYDAHEAWKSQGYRPKEFTHALAAGGGSGLLIGGGAAALGTFLQNGSGAIF